LADNALISVNNLKVSFTIEGTRVVAVDGASFSIEKGKTMGLVGESGCGKSVTSLSVIRLIPEPPGKIEEGEVILNGEDLLKKSESEMEKIRGNKISMIFQEPMTALNPVFKIGMQVSEPFIYHQGLSKEEALQKSIEMLDKVGIPDPAKRVNEYPHQLSGGMRQRVMIAMALACDPDLLIADEPTTALDVTIQAQILELMKKIQKDFNMSILFITHDLGVVAEMCDEVMVMYAGKVFEIGHVKDLFENPLHPYSKGLLKSRVKLDQDRSHDLDTIEGVVPSLFNLPKGCPYQDRCEAVSSKCREDMPPLKDLGNGRYVACFEY
jgi:oligopeptide transport system ATP-binding protein